MGGNEAALEGGKAAGKMPHLHELDRDHEGLLWVGPVQLLGSVADLSKAGGQIHSRGAVLDQLTQGHQLGDGEQSERRSMPSSLLPSTAFLASTIGKHRAGQGATGEQARLRPDSLPATPPSLQTPTVSTPPAFTSPTPTPLPLPPPHPPLPSPAPLLPPTTPTAPPPCKDQSVKGSHSSKDNQAAFCIQLA